MVSSRTITEKLP